VRQPCNRQAELTGIYLTYFTEMMRTDRVGGGIVMFVFFNKMNPAVNITELAAI